ncbi:hypothetical protein E4U40_006224 [Claviceps sp. LM458 group G5]|nr:hypothetical protein E4U40_006224 [Claviceps sp. LM458 group G5]
MPALAIPVVASCAHTQMFLMILSITYAESGVPPETPEQLFNLRHSSIWVIVKKAIGMMKRRWDIFEVRPPEYSVEDQTCIIYTATGLHNFLLMKWLQL